MSFGKKYLVIVFILMAGFGQAFADSFYSSMGLGMPNYYVSPRAVGMGGAGMAANTGQSVNVMNPAAINIFRRTTISIHANMEQVDSKFGGQHTFTRNGNPYGFHFFVPIRSAFTLIAGLQANTSAKYNLSINGSTDYVNYERIVDGSGGLSSGILGLQYKVNETLAFGFKANFNFGTFSEKWTTKFEETGYTTTSDEVSTHMLGTGVDAGLWVLPLENVSLAIVYTSPAKMNLEESILLGSGMRTDTVETDLTLPQGLGVGSHVDLNKFRFAADFYTRLWKQYKKNGAKVNQYSNYIRFGGGVEYLDSEKPTDRYMRRIAYRFGAYYAELPFKDAANDAVSEQFVTAGISLPFHRNAGRIDISLEVGQRKGGGLGYDENIIRLGASFTGSELWFLRRR